MTPNLHVFIVRLATLLGVVCAGIVVTNVTTTSSARAERVCDPPECRTVECWWVGSGHRRCRRECRRRCYWQPPVYYAQPRYAAPTYAPPAPVDSGPAIPPEIVGLGILVVAVVIIAAMMSSASDSTAREIARIEQSILDTQAQAQDAAHRTATIKSYITSEEAAAFERGRRAAEREWDEYTRYD